MEWLMQIFHLVISHVCSIFDSFLQVLYPDISFFQPIMKLFFHSLVFFLITFNHFISFFQLFLKFFLFFFQVIHQCCIPFFDILNISCMDFGYSFFDVIDLQFILPLDCIQFFFQHRYLSLSFWSFLTSLKGFFPVSFHQFLNFIVLDGYHLSETIEFDVKELILLIYVSFEVLQFKVEYFFEFISQFIQLITLFFVWLFIWDSLFFDKFL